MDVPEQHIKLIKSLIKDNKAEITKDNVTIGNIELETGIGQGDANSNSEKDKKSQSYLQ